MAASEAEVERLAHILAQQHGERAFARARQMVEAARRRGDEDEADAWLRVIILLGTLGTPPTSARQ